jgi:DNA-binding NarL/FixJ family response regulator
MPAKPIKVSLVEDNIPLATELQKWIADAPELKCLGVYPTAEAALEDIPATPPDVALVDMRLPGMSGVELIGRLREICPKVQCLVLTMYAEDDLIFEALKAGACGYLLKRINRAEIADAIRKVHMGGSVMTPSIARRVLEMFKTPPAPAQPTSSDSHHLTDREKAVVQAMSEGQARKQIADSLGVSAHAVDYYLRSIYRKLHVNCATAAVSVAIREEIVVRKK